ncbi:Putative transposase [Bradyrhizobium sp. ORS 285]|nr:hypothetical protein BRAO285_790003 [Bradyrhizobium sp. ORS 285]SMX56513.1 Putative transposase [Bradyrhizobium sp. ORS 285]
MELRAYAAALQLSPHSLRKWRYRLATGEVTIDWRAHLQLSARPAVSSSARNSHPEHRMTAAEIGDPATPPAPVRRFFSDGEMLAIARETELPGAKVSAVSRKHGLATGLLFRRRAQFGFVQKKGSKLARVSVAPRCARRGRPARSRASTGGHGGRRPRRWTTCLRSRRQRSGR